MLERKTSLAPNTRMLTAEGMLLTTANSAATLIIATIKANTSVAVSTMPIGGNSFLKGIMKGLVVLITN